MFIVESGTHENGVMGPRTLISVHRTRTLFSWTLKVPWRHANECSWLLMAANGCSWALMFSHNQSWALCLGTMSNHKHGVSAPWALMSMDTNCNEISCYFGFVLPVQELHSFLGGFCCANQFHTKPNSYWTVFEDVAWILTKVIQKKSEIPNWELS